MGVTISIDAMGGDHGCGVTVPAALDALAKFPGLRLILVGDETQILPYLEKKQAKLLSRLDIQHTAEAVAMDESPALALRSKKHSSMRLAIDAVKNGHAKACVSAGNTGALMAISRFVLKMVPGIDRPAIITSIPTTQEKRDFLLLDVGANVDSEAYHLLQFAIMGSVLASTVNGIVKPRVGLLNIGEEAIKGNDVVKKAAELMQAHPHLNFAGNVEADAIYDGAFDVVVCDGFVGNILLKNSEGVVRYLGRLVKATFSQNWLMQVLGLGLKLFLKPVIKRVDPARHNGASLIGLKGIVIKSHGGASKLAFLHAIEVALRQAEKDIPTRIGREIESMLQQGKIQS